MLRPGFLAVTSLILGVGHVDAATTMICEGAMAGPTGQLAQGNIEISTSASFTAPDGSTVALTKSKVQVRNGRFCVSLVPNDTGVPANTTYLITYNLDGGPPTADVWTVRTSVTQLTRNDVTMGPQVPGSPTISLNQLHRGGANNGQAMCFSSVTGWGPGSCGGSGAAWTVNTVPCSASPTFDFAQGNIQQITLTCSVTSASIANLTAGMVAMFRICQDGTGGRTFAWPAAVKTAVTVGTTPLKCSIQWAYSPDGVNLYSQGIGVINQ